MVAVGFGWLHVFWTFGGFRVREWQVSNRLVGFGWLVLVDKGGGVCESALA